MRGDSGSSETHELEDHLAYLKLLENRLTREEISKAKKAEELVTLSDFALINNVSENHVKEAFRYMTCLLQTLTTLTQAHG